MEDLYSEKGRIRERSEVCASPNDRRNQSNFRIKITPKSAAYAWGACKCFNLRRYLNNNITTQKRAKRKAARVAAPLSLSLSRSLALSLFISLFHLEITYSKLLSSPISGLKF